MFLAVHASVGVLAGHVTVRPAVAFLLGLISHFFVDMIPHGDEEIYRGYLSGAKARMAVLYVAADALATIILVTIFFLRQDFFSPLSVSLGIAGSLLPDFLVGLSFLVKPRRRRGIGWRLERFRQFHINNHHFLISRIRRARRDIPLFYGIAFQAVVLIFLVKIIL